MVTIEIRTLSSECIEMRQLQYELRVTQPLAEKVTEISGNAISGCNLAENAYHELKKEMKTMENKSATLSRFTAQRCSLESHYQTPNRTYEQKTPVVEAGIKVEFSEEEGSYYI
ncbi:hypothetical protein Tco_0718765 [Tanacetum coccineum]